MENYVLFVFIKKLDYYEFARKSVLADYYPLNNLQNF